MAKMTKKGIFIGVGVGVGVLLLAAGAGLAVRLLQESIVHSKDSAKEAINKKVSDIQVTALSGNYDKAQKAINDELNKPGVSNDEKYALLFQQGLNYENQKKYDDAIKSYEAAAAINQTQAVYEAAARTAEAKGDKQLAIDYYKKAITLIPPDSPVAESTKQHYETSIKNLGGTP